MSTTITIRTDESLRKALEERAEKYGMSLSQAAREILQEALEERALGEKTRHLRGKLTLNRGQDEPWRKKLRGRNWRS